MDGHDQNIPLVTDTGSGFYRSAFFKIKSHTCLHKLPHLRWSKAVHIRDGLVQPKIYKVKGFHQTMGLKNAILWGSTDDPVYDILLNDWYQSGLYEKAILKAQSCTGLCKSPNSDEAKQSTWEKTWYHIKRKPGDPVNRQGNKIPLGDW